VLGLPQDVNQKAQKGTMFHKVMECLALGKLSLQTGKPQADDVCGLIDASRLYDINYVYELLDKSYEHYKVHAPEKYSPKDYKDIKKWIDDTIAFNGGMFDPRHRRIFAAEQNFNFAIPGSWAVLPSGEKLYLKGTIDLITSLTEDDSLLEVIDWKTGQRKDWATGEAKDLKKLQKDPQLMIYYYALRNLYPNKEILFTINFVRDGGPFTVHYDDDTLVDVDKLLHKRFLEIRKSKVPVLVDPTHRNFKCNKLCHYFKNNYKDTNISICDYIHRKVLNDGIDHVTKTMTADGHHVSNYKAPGE